MQAPEDDRRRHDKFASRDERFICNRTLGFAEVVEDAPASLEILTTSLGQLDPLGRTVEKLRAQLVLKFRNAPAERGQGRAEPARSRAKAHSLDHRDESRHRFQSVHRCFRVLETSIPFFARVRTNFPFESAATGCDPSPKNLTMGAASLDEISIIFVT
jgi:hypothetical protein